VATKQKLTKRQILNELLVVEEKKRKHDVSQTRLYRRGEKLNDSRAFLVEQLMVIGFKEQQKEGIRFPKLSIKDPIIFKQHVFAEVMDAYRNGTSLTIKPIKVVK